MKNNWQTKKIDDVAKICLGLTHTPKYVDKGVPFLSVKDITKGYISFSNTRFISRAEFDSLPYGAKPKKDDVMFCRVGTIGYPQIIKEDKEFGIFVSLGFFRVKKEIILNKYLAYWMQSPIFYNQVDENVKSSTLKNLNTGWLKNFDILLPPLTEQNRIVKILDETFEKIEKAKENTEKNLKNSKDLFESYLNNVFESLCDGWCEKKISDVCDIGAGNSAPQKKEFFVGGKYPFFRTSDVGQIHIGIISNSSDYLNDKGIKGLRLFNKGIILLPKSGASTFLNHRVVLGVDGYVSSHLATIKTDENILNNNYLFYFLQRIKAQDLIQDHKYPSLNLPVIGGIKISYPPLFEQKQIVSKLDALSAKTKKLEAIYKQKLADLEELKRSILKKVFNGEL